MADKIATGRITLAITGAIAGLCQWALIDVLADQLEDQPRLFLFLVTYSGTFFVALLALVGPMRMAPAAIWSAAQALIVAGLLTLASLRFETLSEFLSTPLVLIAAMVLTFVPLPFAIARRVENSWTNYPGLFNHSWDIAVRYASAWIFVGVAWGVIMLSSALFNLVGISLIEDLLEIDPVPFALTGAILGLALAVVNELSDYVSPYLVLRLLRLVLPFVLLVSLVFLIALPFRGLSHIFGMFSAAGTLMAVAMGGAALVTIALDADDEQAVHSPAMRAMAQLTALAIPALGGLAIAAIWMRVGQYGWTPNRLGAATLALLITGYGVLYGLAVLLRSNWGARIRSANILMAVIAMAVSFAWLTPILNPERIATNNQINRFVGGKVSAPQLDLWAMGREWGRPGQAGVARLAAMSDHPEHDILQRRLADLEQANSRYDLVRSEDGPKVQKMAEQVAAVLPVRPATDALPEGALNVLSKSDLDAIKDACARQTPAGNPACLALRVELNSLREGTETLIAYQSQNQDIILMALMQGDADTPIRRNAEHLTGPRYRNLTGISMDALFDQDFQVLPMPMNFLKLGEYDLFFRP